jgi:hypothetical protein
MKKISKFGPSSDDAINELANAMRRHLAGETKVSWKVGGESPLHPHPPHHHLPTLTTRIAGGEIYVYISHVSLDLPLLNTSQTVLEAWRRDCEGEMS